MSPASCPDLKKPAARSCELDLLSRASAGDQDAFGLLYHAHQHLVLASVGKQLQDPDIAWDITQEAFLKAMGAVSRFDPRYTFRSWVTRIARNLAIDYLRKKRPGPWSALNEEDPADSRTIENPAMAVESRELGSRIKKVLGKLSPNHRQVLVLRHLAGLDPRAISNRIGRSLSNTRLQHFRATRAFRETWEKPSLA